MAKGKETERLTDFGEKIGGARKDWAGGRMTQAHLADMTPAEREKYIRKDVIWPTPDYVKLAEEGVDQQVLINLKVFRDAIGPAAPSNDRRARRGVAGNENEVQEVYTGFVAKARELEKCRTLEDQKAFGAELRDWYYAEKEKYPCFRGNNYTLKMTLGSDACSILRIDHYRRGENNSEVLAEPRIHDAARQVSSGLNFYRDNRDWPLYADQAATAARRRGYAPEFCDRAIEVNGERVEGFWVMKNPVSKEGFYRRVDYMGAEEIVKAVGDGLLLGFKEKSQAWDAARKVGQAFLDSRKKKREKARAEILGEEPSKEEDQKPLSLAGLERKGPDWRKGADATPEMFLETFGFRGVEFGNWTNQKERQEHLNQAYDGFMDIAAILGMEPRGISFDGKLALAFGARGTGGQNAAAAHYEPGREVINLTRFSGAGCLAHEWFHGLDHSIALRLEIGSAADLASEVAHRSDRKAVQLMDANPELSGLQTALTLSQHSVATTETGVASAMKNADEAKEQVGIWLKHAYRNLIYKARRYQTETPAKDDLIKKGEQEIAQFVSALEQQCALEPDNQGKQRAAVEKGLPRLYAEWGKRVREMGMKRTFRGPPSKDASGIEHWADTFITRMGVVRKAHELTTETIEKNPLHYLLKRMPTEVYKAWKAADKIRSKPYYTLPEERLARCFEGYVGSALEERGWENDYLIAHRKSHSPLYPKGRELEMVSRGLKPVFEAIRQLYGVREYALEAEPAVAERPPEVPAAEEARPIECPPAEKPEPTVAESIAGVDPDKWNGYLETARSLLAEVEEMDEETAGAKI